MKHQKKILFLSIIVIFSIGLIGGFYLALYLQSQTILLAGLAILFVFLMWLGSGVELMGLLRDWYREEKEKPQLSIEYDKQKRIYSPELSKNASDKIKICNNKYLKVLIRNTGGIARNCKAELRVINWNKHSIVPSEEQKFLAWCQSFDGSLQKDIVVNGEEYLHVVFSDSRLKNLPNNEIYAFVSTFDSLNPEISRYKGQYGFGIGDFDIEIIVKSEDGSIAKSKFKLHVDEDYGKLSME